MGQFVAAPTIFFVLCDSTMLFGVVYSLLLFSLPVANEIASYQSVILSVPVYLALMLTMIASGCYEASALYRYQSMSQRVIIAFVLAGAVYTIIAMITDIMTMTQVTVILLSCLGCTLALRAVFAKLCSKLFQQRIIVLGTGSQARRIFELTLSGRNAGIVPVIFLKASRDELLIPGSVEELDLTAEAPRDRLAKFVLSAGVREIIVATEDRRGLPIDQLLQCRLLGIKVTEYLKFWEEQNGTLDLDSLRASWLIFGDGLWKGPLTEATKRAFDIAGSLLLFILTLPIFLLTALFISLERNGPIFYRQERVGRHERRFILIKFRSMRVDGDSSPGPRKRSNNDPRITRVGAIIRRFRIDELPQLLNVLRGEMSIIGPRPEQPCFVEQLSQAVPYYSGRHSVKPGITGWAQINSPDASVEDAREKLAFDLYYIKNRTILFDMFILLRTFGVILSPNYRNRPTAPPVPGSRGDRPQHVSA
jgi:sugar transferase (PEP-CTERM system associated)